MRTKAHTGASIAEGVVMRIANARKHRTRHCACTEASQRAQCLHGSIAVGTVLARKYRSGHSVMHSATAHKHCRDSHRDAQAHASISRSSHVIWHCECPGCKGLFDKN